MYLGSAVFSYFPQSYSPETLNEEINFMPSVLTPTERWFDNLEKLQDCAKNINHLTATSLKQFSHQTLGSLLTSDLMKGQLGLCCQNKGIGLVPNSAFADMTKNFFFFLETVGNIPLARSLRSQIFSVVVRHRPELITSPPSTVIRMSLDNVFGNNPLNSNVGKKDLDLTLNLITPDDFYPTDGSLFNDGTKSLNFLVEQITN